MKIKSSPILFLVAMLGSILANAQRTTVSLNEDWQFTPGHIVYKNVYQRVNLPHTWNRTDVTDTNHYYRGLGNYEKGIFIDRNWKGKRLFLKFNGVNTIANVFINKKHALEHRGGYTAFVVEITDLVTYGEENNLMVRVNNAPQLDIMPLVGDFNMYGGIYRDVNLIITDKATISLLDHASSGVYLSQKTVSKSNADVSAKIVLSNPEKQSGLELQLEVFNGKAPVVSKMQSVSSSNKEVLFDFNIKNPRLWNGTKDPFSYSVVVNLLRNGKVVDKVEQPLGLRYFSVDANKGFFLNGEHIQLRGVCRHQDRSEYGNAIRKEHHEEDLAIIREVGANAIRLSHYPYDKYFYNLLDKAGIVAWSEIPFIGPGGYRDKGFVNQQSFIDNGKLQLVELIRQNYNHPSILFWGLFNEIKQDGDDPLDFVKELQELAKKEDPYRLTTAASNQKGDLNTVTDIIAWNKYFGWYGRTVDHVGKWADETHAKHPNLKIGISEYGAGGSIYHHEEELKKTVPGSMWHPEEWQTHFHEEHWKAINERPFIWGTFVWNMFDFGASHRKEGLVTGINDKGLVTFDRKHKKDAFWFYKANWNTNDSFVRVSQKNFKNRSNAKPTIKVYSNLPEVELIVNGKSYGKKKGSYGTFIWESIPLQEGNNTIIAKSKKKKEVFTDTAHWSLVLKQ